MKISYYYLSYIFPLVICVAILISGCSGFNPEKIQALEEGVYVNPRLPAIKVEVDERSLETTYWTLALVSPSVKPESLKNYQGDLYDHYDDLKLFGFFWNSHIIGYINPIIQDNEMLLEIKRFTLKPSTLSHKIRRKHKDSNVIYSCIHSFNGIQTSVEVDGKPVIETWVSFASNSPNIKSILTYYKLYAEDSKNILNRELTRDLFEPESMGIKGYAKCRILSWDSSFSERWLFYSLFSGFTLNFFGLPIFSHSSSITIEAKFFDAKGGFIARYIGTGKTTKYVAMHWGYSGLVNPFNPQSLSACHRAANSEALANALKKIRRAIQRDSEMLRKRLTNDG